MADELNWSGAFYEALAGSVGRVTRGGPLGMAAGVIGEASAAMGGMNVPWQGPRTAASLAAAVGGGFFLLNAGRGVVEATNAAGQGDYGSALANAAIGVGWYAAGRFALGTLGRQLPVEAGALAAYEKAAEANFAREDPARYQQVIGRFKKQRDMAQAAVDSAAVANSNSVNPTTAQAAAERGAELAVNMAATRADGNPPPGYTTGGKLRPRYTTARTRPAGSPPPGYTTGGKPIPRHILGGQSRPKYALGGSPTPRRYDIGGNLLPEYGRGSSPTLGYDIGGNLLPEYGRGSSPRPAVPIVVSSASETLSPVVTRRGTGGARRFFSGAGRFFSGAGRFFLGAGRSFSGAGRFFLRAGRRFFTFDPQAVEKWATMFAEVSMRGIRF